MNDVEEINILFLLDNQNSYKTLIYTITNEFKTTFLLEQCITQKQSDFDRFLVTIPRTHVKRIAAVMNGDTSFPQKMRIIKRQQNEIINNNQNINENETDKIFNPESYDKMMSLFRLQNKSDRDTGIQVKMCIDIPLSNIVTNLNDISERLQLNKSQHLNMDCFKSCKQQDKFLLMQACIKGVQPQQLCKKLSMCYKVNKIYRFDQIKQKIEDQQPQQFYPKDFKQHAETSDFTAWGSSDNQSAIFQNAQHQDIQYTKGFKYVAGFADLQNKPQVLNFLEINNREKIQQTVILSFINDLQQVLQSIIQNKYVNKTYYIDQIEDVVFEKKLSSNTYCMMRIKNAFSNIFMDYEESFIYTAEQMYQHLLKVNQSKTDIQSKQQQDYRQQYMTNSTDNIIKSNQTNQKSNQDSKQTDSSKYDNQVIQTNNNYYIKTEKLDKQNSIDTFNHIQQKYDYNSNRQKYNNLYTQQQEEVIVSDNEDIEIVQDQQQPYSQETIIIQQQKQNQQQILQNQQQNQSKLSQKDLVLQDLNQNDIKPQSSKDLRLSSLVNNQQQESDKQLKQGSLVDNSTQHIASSNVVTISNKNVSEVNDISSLQSNNVLLNLQQNILSILNNSDDEMENE